MKKYFLYELKKNLLPMLVFTVIGTLIYVAAVLNTTFIYSYNTVPGYGRSNLISIPAIVLCTLCTLVPIMMFSFKMNRRTVDCFYSAPIKREKLYLVKSLVGLIMVLAPYTICYWLGFIATALKPNIFNMAGFVPAFFISIPLAFLLFGINAFAFSRANSVHDGIIFIGFFAFAFVMAFVMLSKFILMRNADMSYWFTYSPLVHMFSLFNQIIDVGHINYPYKYEWLLYLFGGLTGAGCWAGLFLSLRTEKAENAEQVSDSWFGYKVFIPFYAVLIIGQLNFGYDAPLYLAMFFAATVIGYMIYRRTFVLRITDWIVIAGALVLGMVLALLPAARIIYDPITVVTSSLIRFL